MPFCIGGDGATTQNAYGAPAATNYINLLEKLAGFLDNTNHHMRSLAVNSGGSNYTVGDTVSVNGGSIVQNMNGSARVTAVSSGVVTAVEVASMGCYSVPTTATGVATTNAQVTNPAATGLTVDITSGQNGYTIERDQLVGAGPERELIVRGQGLDAAQQIFFGFQTHSNSTADKYNIKVLGMAGFDSGQDFLNQPGIQNVVNLPPTADMPLINTSIPFWFYVNDQRIWIVARAGTTYIHGGAGYGLPYGPLTTYPYPLFWCGTAAGPDRLGGQGIRFSVATGQNSNILSAPRGACYFRYLAGQTYAVANNIDGNGSALNSSAPHAKCFPVNQFNGSNKSLNSLGINSVDILRNARDTNGEYPFLPIQFWDGGIDEDFFNGMVMEMDRIYAVPGFSLNSEDTLLQDGVKHRVFQNVFRTGRDQFIAIEES